MSPEAAKPRRRRGDGSVYQRKDGRYAYSWTDVTGVPRVKYAKTEALARTKLRAALADRDKGLPVITRVYTLGAWMDVWMAGHAVVLRPRSRVRYEAAVKRWQGEAIAGVKVADLLPEHVTGVLVRWTKTGVGVAAQAFALTILRMALDGALLSGHAGRNVARAPYVRTPRVTPRPIEPPHGPELDALRAAIAEDELEAVWVLALDAGLRQGEILALRWSAVDLERGRVKVVGTLEYGSGEVGPPKSRRGERDLPVIPAVTDALRRHRESLGVIPHPESFVFANAQGRPMNARMVLDAWYDVCARAKVRRYRMHDLRHAFVTGALERGLDIAMLSRYVGHSTIEMTVDKYGHQSLQAPR